MIIGDISNIQVYDNKISLKVNNETISVYPGDRITLFCDPFLYMNYSGAWIKEMDYSEFRLNIEKNDDEYEFSDDLAYCVGIGVERV